MKEILLFISAVVPVIIICGYIYMHDREKEPVELLIKLFMCGVVSVFIVLIISHALKFICPYLYADTDDFFQILLNNFIGIALIEEISKWGMLYLFSYNNKEFDDIYDMLVYSAFVSLGFAFFENLEYLQSYGMSVAIHRALFSVPGHAFFAIFMGYYLGLSKLTSINHRNDLNIRYTILSILVPVLLHGTFDTILSFVINVSPYFWVVFLFFIIILYILTIKKIIRMASINKKLQ